MNRAVALTLAATCAALITGGPWVDLARAQADAGADQGADQDAQKLKQKHIDEYQEYRLIFEPKAGPNGEHQIRQGPDVIYDSDFVQLMDDPSLNRFWYGERNRDYAFWIGTGVAFVPLGSLLFYQNFLGQGQTAVFSTGTSNPALASSVSDWRTFTLSVAGAALAIYGVYNLTLWVMEELDFLHPNRLDADSIAPRVRDWNDALANRLDLSPKEIPSPPTPRPSPTPTPSTSPGASPLLPSPLAPEPNTFPEGTPPSYVPYPLPLLQPGDNPLPTPSPSMAPPMPSVLPFPGFYGESSPIPSPALSPAASPHP